MKYWLLIQLLFIVAIPNNAFAQIGLGDPLREMEMQRLQMEANSVRMQAETERFMDRIMSERAARKAAEREERVAAEQAESARKAKESADDLRDEISRAEVTTKNTLYLAVLVIGLAAFMVFVIKRKRRNIPMQENEKFGLVIIIVSFLMATLALMISATWWPQYDFLTNLMTTLKIQLIVDESGSKYFIDFPTKYFLLVCLSIAAYGVTTYLGITSAPRKQQISPPEQ